MFLNQFEYFKNMLIGEGVLDKLAIAVANDQSRLAQGLELVGDGGLRHVHDGRDFTDGPTPLVEKRKNLIASRIAKGFEEVDAFFNFCGCGKLIVLFFHISHHSFHFIIKGRGKFGHFNS